MFVTFSLFTLSLRPTRTKERDRLALLVVLVFSLSLSIPPSSPSPYPNSTFSSFPHTPLRILYIRLLSLSDILIDAWVWEGKEEGREGGRVNLVFPSNVQ